MNKKSQPCRDVSPAVYLGQIQDGGPAGSETVHAYGGASLVMPHFLCFLPNPPPHGTSHTRDGAQEDTALDAAVDVVIALGFQRGAGGQDRMKRLEAVGFR